jgi:hypothetical protein
VIHEVAVNLGQQLAGRKCPIPVLDGPDRRLPTTFGRERIIVEHDPNGDSFAPTHIAGPRLGVPPRNLLTRSIGVKITIYAQNPNKGSPYWEHKRRAELVLDMVLCALRTVGQVRQNWPGFRSGKFVDTEDLKASETPGGAIYELFVTVDRGVADRNWDGSADPTVIISPQMVGGQAVTFAASGSTLTRSGGSWLDDKFAVGQVVIVTGSAHNNGTLTPITVLSDLVMTFASGLVNEGPVSGVTITGNGVVINNTTTAVGYGGEDSEIAAGNGGT